jgi:hypothetical protein
MGTATSAEDCTPPVVIPRKPDPRVEVTQSEDPDCDSTEIRITTVTTNIDWVLNDDNEWDETRVVSEEVTTRPQKSGRWCRRPRRHP